ncbi:hypothetical protein FNYG_03373 [Fusarium nygamai]|uniref:Uncharacterized protein n=1 Tax=Gibberella nygamai TaxID=42673 RepID=A0A2K0WLA2_GIBNY|nr:hypothetical protein FNYG_03373 [Fusarium nygamai]
MTTPEETTTTTAKETTSTASGTATDTTTNINTGTTTDAATESTTEVMETSTEASSSVTLEELPNSTMATTVTTSVERIDTVTEYSTIVINSITTPTSDTATQTAPNSSNESTTSLETTSLSESSIDSITTSREEVQVSSTILAVPTSTDEVTLSLSSGLSSGPATTPIPEMTTAESLETSAAEETESSTGAISNPGEETSFSDAITSTAQDTPSPATSTAATSSAVPTNLAVIGNFKFFGCLGSAAGYPSFDLIGEGPDMITAECARLGKGRAYIGIYQSPDSRLRRRDAPPGILLTLYAQIEAISSSLTTSEAPSTAGISALTAASTEITLQPILTSESSGLPTENPTFSNSPPSSTETFAESVITLEPSVPVTRSQGPKPVRPHSRQLSLIMQAT